ncbi:MAG: hypothetical protein ACLGI6_13390 [Gammaproteobacteria bacterium]
MLTATYTLVALSVEQAAVRVGLQALQKLLHSSFIDQDVLTPPQIQSVVDTVRRLYESYHWRKVDMFLVPALRNATDSANHLLRELDELARTAADAVGVAAAKVGSAALDTHTSISQFCAAVDTFCCACLQRLEREEHDLFPMARAVISGETWFSIANKMLAHDAYVQDRKQVRQLPTQPARARTAIELGAAPIHVGEQGAWHAIDHAAEHLLTHEPIGP